MIQSIGVFWLIIASLSEASAAETTNAYLTFIRSRAAELRSADHAPTTLPEWTQRSVELRRQLSESWE